MSDGGPPGVNSAISSGAAFGSGGNVGPGSIMPLFNIFENLGKVVLKGEEGTRLFSGEFLGGGGSGLGGLKDTGIFSKIFDSIFAGADAKEAFALFAAESQASSSSGSIRSGGLSGIRPSLKGVPASRLAIWGVIVILAIVGFLAR